MTINGPGASLVTLKGGGASSNFRVLSIDGGINTVISGMTITGGNVTGGGGAIADRGTLTLSDTALSGNTATSSGGAIMDYGASNYTLTLTDCTVTGNSATTGGGIDGSFSSNTTLIDSIISDNTADPDGGGIATWGRHRIDGVRKQHLPETPAGIAAESTAMAASCTCSIVASPETPGSQAAASTGTSGLQEVSP